jgi:effector-binding domain-containing protein
MNLDFIELLTWMIAGEMIKDDESKRDDHFKIFGEICNFLSSQYDIEFKSKGPLSESHIGLANKMIDYYKTHFVQVSHDKSDPGGDIKLINFTLMNGKYNTEFRELKMIGGGSFGNVYKALNQLDHQEYAIKKVALYGNQYNNYRELYY